MLFLLFQLGKDRYALEASRVVEVVPLLALKTIPQAPQGVAGMVVYRGRAIPALDLCHLLLGRPARERLSTRMLIINHSDAPGRNQWLGLIVERATEMMQRDVRDFREAGVKPASAPFLGPVVTDDRGVIQLLHAQELLAAKARELLFAGAASGGECRGSGPDTLPMPPHTSEEASPRLRGGGEGAPAPRSRLAEGAAGVVGGTTVEGGNAPH
jgi:chemotaxis-related protein WspB